MIIESQKVVMTKPDITDRLNRVLLSRIIFGLLLGNLNANRRDIPHNKIRANPRRLPIEKNCIVIS